MNPIFYAIDMGAPSGKYSGFYGWRYDPASKDLKSYAKSAGWYSAIRDIQADSRNHEVHVTVEAALWGMRKRKNGDWVRRFHLERKKDWSERPWYTGAGAATGLMAQVFLNQIVSSKPKRKRITVRESYISGLSFEGCSLTVPKPQGAIISFKSSHACDAFEGLLLTLEDGGVDLRKTGLSFKGENVKLDRWHSLSPAKFHRIKMREEEMFPLGILENTDLFDFQLGKILFTKRDFGKFPSR